MSENTIYLVTGSFDNELEIFQLKPDKQSDRFLELVTFMSHGKLKNISSQECMYILCIYGSRYLNEKVYACIYLYVCIISKELTYNSLITHYWKPVCPCYPDECGKLPLDLLQLLENQAAVLHPDVRLTCIYVLCICTVYMYVCSRVQVCVLIRLCNASMNVD